MYLWQNVYWGNVLSSPPLVVLFTGNNLSKLQLGVQNTHLVHWSFFKGG